MTNSASKQIASEIDNEDFKSTERNVDLVEFSNKIGEDIKKEELKVFPTNISILPSQITIKSQPKKEISEYQLSQLQITKDGLLGSNYSLINEYSARIVEINALCVIAECLVDPENKTIETRKFDQSLFKGLDDLKQGRLIFIQILQGHLEQVIRIQGETNGRILKSDFEINTPENILKGFDFKRLNKK